MRLLLISWESKYTWLHLTVWGILLSVAFMISSCGMLLRGLCLLYVLLWYILLFMLIWCMVSYLTMVSTFLMPNYSGVLILLFGFCNDFTVSFFSRDSYCAFGFMFLPFVYMLACDLYQGFGSFLFFLLMFFLYVEFL